MLWETQATTNPAPAAAVPYKTWKCIGNGVEVLAKKDAVKVVTESDAIVATKGETEKITAGDMVFWNDKWVEVSDVKDKVVTVKQGGTKIETELEKCQKRIPIQILLCTSSATFVRMAQVNGRTELSKLAKKLAKQCSTPAKKADWHFNGKTVDAASTIEGLALKPNDKLACMLLGYEMKTYKRFTRLDDRGWYMSRSSKDFIAFVALKSVMLFGFGMYYTREGPPTYTMGYEMLLNDEVKAQAVLTVTKPAPEDEVYPVYFDPLQNPIPISAGTKIAIVVRYENYEDASRLRVGTGGREHEDIEGNEKGLFQVESYSAGSSNGTDVNSGQIPELYYAIQQ